jgi:hypothetical protein
VLLEIELVEAFYTYKSGMSASIIKKKTRQSRCSVDLQEVLIPPLHALAIVLSLNGVPCTDPRTPKIAKIMLRVRFERDIW